MTARHRSPTRPFRRLPQFTRSLAAYAWAAPCTALGLVLGVGALVFGGRASLVGGVLEVALARPGTAACARAERWPFGAITFGHVVIGASGDVLAALRGHERAHVRQYECWGPAFLVAYPLSSLVQALRGRHPYRDNHFEVQARATESPRASG